MYKKNTHTHTNTLLGGLITLNNFHYILKLLF